MLDLYPESCSLSDNEAGDDDADDADDADDTDDADDANDADDADERDYLAEEAI